MSVSIALVDMSQAVEKVHTTYCRLLVFLEVVVYEAHDQRRLR
jgi:hypothetical protein